MKISIQHTLSNRYFIFLVISIFYLTSCTKTEFVPNEPKLEIRVIDENNTVVAGAEVLLFTSLDDWKSLHNRISLKMTNGQGVALFEELEEKVYYFFVSKGQINNGTNVSYLEDPLKINYVISVTTTIR